MLDKSTKGWQKRMLKAILKEEFEEEQVGPAGEFGHVKNLWKFTKPENHPVKEEVPPWGQMYGQGRLKTDFADTVATDEYAASGQGQIQMSHYMEDETKDSDSNPWAIESAMRGKGYHQECTMDESAPPNFPKKLYKKVKAQYPGNAEAAYATMWKIHNKMEERVSEMQNPLKETSASGGVPGYLTPNAFTGTSKAGSSKMKKTAEKSGYKLAGKIDKADPMEENKGE